MLLYKILINLINSLALILPLIIIIKISLFINSSEMLLNNYINKKDLYLIITILKPNILN